MRVNYLLFFLVIAIIAISTYGIFQVEELCPGLVYLFGLAVGATFCASCFFLKDERDRYRMRDFIRRFDARTKAMSQRFSRTFGSAEIIGYAKAMDDVRKFVRTEWR